MRALMMAVIVLLSPALAHAQHPFYQGGPSFPDVIHMTDVLGQPGSPITLVWNGSDRWTGTDAAGIAIALEPVDGKYFVSIGVYRWSFSELDASLTTLSPPKVVYGVDRLLPNGLRNRRGAPPMAGPIMDRFGWTGGNWTVAEIPTFIVTP